MHSAPNQKAAETHWTSSKTGRRELRNYPMRHWRGERGICLISMLYEFFVVVSDPAYRGVFSSFKT